MGAAGAPCCACGLVTTHHAQRDRRATRVVACCDLVPAKTGNGARSACVSLSPGRLENSSSGLSSVHRVAWSMHSCRTMPIKRLLPVLLAAAASAQTACRPAGRRRRRPATGPTSATRRSGRSRYDYQAPRHSLPAATTRAASSSARSSRLPPRLLCLHSADELHFVVNTSHIDGWVGYEQDKQAARLQRAGGGWGWTTCSSTWTASWANVSAPPIASPAWRRASPPSPLPVI